MQQPGQLGGWDQRHPAHAEPLRTRRQPQVLDGTGARPQVGVGVAGPTQDAIGGGATVTTNHDTEGGLPDALQLEIQQPSSRIRAELRRLGEAFPIGKKSGAVAGGRVTHHDEAPGLAVTDRRGHVGGGQDTSQDVVGNRLRTEPANIASRAQHGVECLTLGGGKRPRMRVALAVQGGGGIADEGNRA